MNKTTAYLSLGSNLGDKMQNCEQALEQIAAERTCFIILRSSWYRTQPWGEENQDWFVNGVVQISTSLNPEELLKRCKNIEQWLGRENTGPWGPRIIDLDILFYDELRFRTPDLEIPHPLLHERNFVLIPLMEIAPELMHPVLKKSVRDLWLTVKDRNEVQKIVRGKT